MNLKKKNMIAMVATVSSLFLSLLSAVISVITIDFIRPTEEMRSKAQKERSSSLALCL